ncbi:T-cell receptor gamma alternate reading frame protein [Heliangelus exortis]|uniref:T-cell receptor gamma alternate reading frame protein n=1 Tax=Heliangelus exortis TaxID=472823 RepID=UPI003A8EED86
MLLLAMLVTTATWSFGLAQEIPLQSPISITKFKGSARMTCEIQTSRVTFDETVIHWYQQKEGKAPERILFFISGKSSVESGFQLNRYMVEKVSAQNRSIFTIKDVIPDDTATYYCAYWESRSSYWIKYFGKGTKLIVSNQGNSPPANSEILQSQHKNQLTYVCLIEKFYPEVIRVTWTDGEKEITENVVKGDAWKSAKGDEYSISSWLTVPAENKDKNYYCKYEHESQQETLTTQAATETTSQQEECSTYPGHSTGFNRDHLMHRTAYLVYIIILLKSSMYYFIVLFFIYRMWASTKNQGKKA